jgi:hypothetical protein
VAGNITSAVEIRNNKKIRQALSIKRYVPYTGAFFEPPLPAVIQVRGNITLTANIGMITIFNT